MRKTFLISGSPAGSLLASTMRVHSSYSDINANAAKLNRVQRTR